MSDPEAKLAWSRERLHFTNPSYRTPVLDGALLRLLGRSTVATSIALHVRGIIGLADNALECLPSLADRWRSALVRNKRVDPRGGVSDGVLDKRALGVSSAEKGQVRQQQDPASPGESKGGQDQAEQKRELERSDESHTGIVVSLDELSDAISQG